MVLSEVLIGEILKYVVQLIDGGALGGAHKRDKWSNPEDITDAVYFSIVMRI